MNNKTPAKGSHVHEVKSLNALDQVSANSKKDQSVRVSSDIKEKPRSVTSIPVMNHTFGRVSTQDQINPSSQTSIFTPSLGSLRTRAFGGGFIESHNDLASSDRTQDSECTSIIYKEGEENIDASRTATPQETEEIDRVTSQNAKVKQDSLPTQPHIISKNSRYKQVNETEKQWELPFKSYFDLQVSPRLENQNRTSLHQKLTPQDLSMMSPQDSNLLRRDANPQASFSSGLPYSPGNTLHASRYVFDGKKRQDSKEGYEQKRPESTELKHRRFVSPHEERLNDAIGSHKSKSMLKSGAIAQSLALSKGSGTRKSLLQDSFQTRKPNKVETVMARSPRTPIAHLLVTEEDVLGAGQRLHEDIRAQTRTPFERRANDEDKYFSVSEITLQKGESFISPKSVISIRKTNSSGKKAYQSLRDIDNRIGKTLCGSTGGRNMASLSLNSVPPDNSSLGVTIIEFPPADNSGKKQLESFRVDTTAEKRESLEKGTTSITGIKSPLKGAQSPSPIRGVGFLQRDRIQKLEDTRVIIQDKSLIGDQILANESKEKQLKINNYYSGNGIKERVRVAPRDQIHFYKMFENTKFTYYVCDYVLELPKEEGGINSNGCVQECLNKRILLASKGIILISSFCL